ncbi:Protein SRT-53 [Aphelenchoides avenae]|nr:Protein SRT-53 [Aphelenchus avenae]
MMFVQVFLISVVNASASSLYICMQFVHISEFLIVLGQFLWMCAHGLPALICLLINRTIRRDCKNMLPKFTKLDTARPLHIPIVCAALPERDNGATA